MTGLLAIRNLEAWYGPAQALFGVDLDVAAGEVVALMGRNGMGKTTTIRALCGLMRPCRGTVVLEDQDVLGASPTTSRVPVSAWFPRDAAASRT